MIIPSPDASNADSPLFRGLSFTVHWPRDGSTSGASMMTVTVRVGDTVLASYRYYIREKNTFPNVKR